MLEKRPDKLQHLGSIDIEGHRGVPADDGTGTKAEHLRPPLECRDPKAPRGEPGDGGEAEKTGQFPWTLARPHRALDQRPCPLKGPRPQQDEAAARKGAVGKPDEGFADAGRNALHLVTRHNRVDRIRIHTLRRVEKRGHRRGCEERNVRGRDEHGCAVRKRRRVTKAGQPRGKILEQAAARLYGDGVSRDRGRKRNRTNKGNSADPGDASEGGEHTLDHSGGTHRGERFGQRATG